MINIEHGFYQFIHPFLLILIIWKAIHVIIFLYYKHENKNNIINLKPIKKEYK